MDNNKERKPEKKHAPKKKKVSKKVIRQRQLCALAIIALIVLIIIILIAKGCSNIGTGEGETSEPVVTTTGPAVTETVTTPPETTTTVVTTMNPLAASVKLNTRELFVNVGDYDTSVYARIESYPDENTGEANEVWKSMDESIATVNEWGAVTGVSVGETYIILSFDNHPEIEIEIKVHVADASAITPEVTTIDGGMAEPTPDTPTTPVYGYSEGLDDENTF